MILASGAAQQFKCKLIRKSREEKSNALSYDLFRVQGSKCAASSLQSNFGRKVMVSKNSPAYFGQWKRICCWYGCLLYASDNVLWLSACWVLKPMYSNEQILYILSKKMCFIELEITWHCNMASQKGVGKYMVVHRFLYC